LEKVAARRVGSRSTTPEAIEKREPATGEDERTEKRPGVPDAHTGPPG